MRPGLPQDDGRADDLRPASCRLDRSLMGAGERPANQQQIIVPAAVRVDGKNGAFFQTDLWIRCRTVPVAATLHFHTADAASEAPAVTVPMTLTQPGTSGSSPGPRLRPSSVCRATGAARAAGADVW